MVSNGFKLSQIVSKDSACSKWYQRIIIVRSASFLSCLTLVSIELIVFNDVVKDKNLKKLMRKMQNRIIFYFVSKVQTPL